jgi:hypothetical protein
VQNGERVEPPLNVLSPENLHVGTGRELLDARRQQLPVRYGKCGRPARGHRQDRAYKQHRKNLGRPRCAHKEVRICEQV